MNKKLQKTINIILITVIIMAMVISIVVSIDSHHPEICETEHCDVCALIEFAKAIITIIFYTFSSLLSGFLIYFFLSRLEKTKYVKTQKSLVSQKVQQNE